MVRNRYSKQIVLGLSLGLLLAFGPAKKANDQDILIQFQNEDQNSIQLTVEDEVLNLKVTNRVNNKSYDMYSGTIIGKENSVFTITHNSNGFSGFVWLKDDKVTYTVQSIKDEIQLIPSDIHHVLCLDYGKGSTQDVSKTIKPGVQADVPTLESNPGSAFTIYLDFDGEVVTGTRWNTPTFGLGDTYTANPRGFSTGQMEEIFKYVAQDFIPFDINVTTDRTVFDATPIEKRVMCIFTSSAFVQAGGIAQIGSFNTQYDDPCFVFQSILQLTATSASHEIGHTMGLYHDATPGTGYYEGHNDWGPLMGIAFDQKLDQWSKGEYKNANNQEDDLAIITQNGFDYREDDHGNSISNSTELNFNNDVISGNNLGLIEQNTDVDAFQFETNGGYIDILIENASEKTNLKPLARLLDENGLEITQSTYPHPETKASFNQYLSPGIYYITIEGTGSGDPQGDGYSDYGSLGDYIISGEITGNTTSIHELNAMDFDLYPNPVEDHFTIKSSYQIEKWELISTSGQIFQSGNRNNVYIENQVSGIFYLRVYSEKQIMIKKVQFR